MKHLSKIFYTLSVLLLILAVSYLNEDKYLKAISYFSFAITMYSCALYNDSKITKKLYYWVYFTSYSVFGVTILYQFFTNTF